MGSGSDEEKNVTNGEAKFDGHGSGDFSAAETAGLDGDDDGDRNGREAQKR